MNIKVKKRNGRLVPFEVEKINRSAERACENLENVSPSEIVLDAKIKLYDKVKTLEIDKSLISSASSKIEKEPNYNLVAARLLLNTIYKEVFGESVYSESFDLQYHKSFIVNLKKLVKEGIIDKRLTEEFDLKKLSEALDTSRDLNWKYLGIQTIYDRYLLHIDGRRMESPQGFFMRVAMGLALAEKENKEEWAIKFYNTLSSFDLMSSTPTLFNSGTMHSQLSSCYLNTFEDSIDGIFDGLWQEARKSKFAGGLGMDISNLRSRGSYIKGTNGENQGPVYFWKLYGDMLVAVNQGGKRKGAGCAYLETWHADIDDFLELRKNVGDERMRAHDMNTANWIPDLFLQQVEKDESWYLFSPNETPELHEIYGEEFEQKYWEYVEKGKAGELRVFKEIKAKDLWKKMLKALFETGHPWITFKDPSNIRYSNQHVGTVHSSNLCTEILLHTKPTTFKDNNRREVEEYGETAVCNLASINLKNHLKVRTLDYDKIQKTVEIGMRMLDNVVDINFYPTKESENANMRHRPVGLGSMGWHDVFYALDIDYSSEEAVALSDKIYENISYAAILGSSKLAKERGTYQTYKGSLWDQNILPIDTYKKLLKTRGKREKVETTLDWNIVRDHIKQYGMRNSNTMAIAPTATISYICGCSQSIEPNFGVMFVYSTLSGEFTQINEYFVEDIKKLGLWSQEFVNVVKSIDGDLSKLENGKLPEKILAKYKTAFQQDQLKLIDCGAARQKWIDQGQSLNLYNNKTSLKFLNDMYMHAWKSCLKTTYYLRNTSASTVEKSTVSSKKEYSAEEVAACSIEAMRNGEECEACQ
jgi:ribonucleoside-diphosphate reductase alpha chain